MNYWTQSPENIYVAAHRGWSAEYPENTMLAFRKAAELGVDQIEIDVRMTKDGELVIIHDPTVDRTTDGTGNVCDLTLEEIKKLDAGVKKDARFAGERIPTFTEFMDYIKDFDMMTLDIELKLYPEDFGDTAYEVCDRVFAMLVEYGFKDRCVINSFSSMLNEYVHKKNEGWKQHVYYPIEFLRSYDKCEDPYSYAYCCCMFGAPKGEFTGTAESYTAMKAKGVQPWAGASIKDQAGVDEAIAKKAELITCNNPDVVLECLRKRGAHK